MVKISLTIPFFCILLSVQAFSQSVTDTTFLAASSAKAKTIYHQFIQGNAHLYNGSEYKSYQSIEEEHPYFISNDWVVGAIVYDNELYENVEMMYNLRNDKVVIENYSNSNTIELVSKKISEFILRGHTFVALMPDSAKQIEEGFYDLLYNGNVKVYARRIKQYEERLEGSLLHASFNEKYRYFFFKDGKYFLVSSKASVLDVLSDRKKELKQYLSRSHFRFKKEKENALVKLAGYYDTLKE